MHLRLQKDGVVCVKKKKESNSVQRSNYLSIFSFIHPSVHLSAPSSGTVNGWWSVCRSCETEFCRHVWWGNAAWTAFIASSLSFHPCFHFLSLSLSRSSLLSFCVCCLTFIFHLLLSSSSCFLSLPLVLYLLPLLSLSHLFPVLPLIALSLSPPLMHSSCLSHFLFLVLPSSFTSSPHSFSAFIIFLPSFFPVLPFPLPPSLSSCPPPLPFLLLSY